jgi:hypothetical protein
VHEHAESCEPHRCCRGQFSVHLTLQVTVKKSGAHPQTVGSICRVPLAPHPRCSLRALGARWRRRRRRRRWWGRSGFSPVGPCARALQRGAAAGHLRLKVAAGVVRGATLSRCLTRRWGRSGVRALIDIAHAPRSCVTLVRAVHDTPPLSAWQRVRPRDVATRAVPPVALRHCTPGVCGSQKG